MSVLDTKHKRKSAVITATILAVLLFLIFNFGMQYLDPPEEYGIAINYGVSNVGQEKPKTIPVRNTPKPPVKEEKVEEVVKEVTKEPVEQTENILTDEEAEQIAIKKKEEEKAKAKAEKERIERLKKEAEEKKRKEKEKAVDNLFNKIKNSDGKPQGEGDDNKDGVKGKKNGDPNSSKYYGNTGSGGKSNYNLAGRRALTKPIEQPDCQEEGTVVVSIEVDKNGRVIRAVPGVKGTTNSAKCLLDPAREAAMKTTWNAAADAPPKQKGTIIYKFSLTK